MPPPELAIEPLLAAWREEQGGGAGGGNATRPVKFVLEVEASRDNAALEVQSAALLRVDLRVRDLFAKDRQLDAFRLVEVIGVSRPDRADLFEVANVLQRHLRATTVEPDLGTDYFQCELPMPDGPTPESIDWAFWCWSDPKTDLPSDPDWAVKQTRIADAWSHSANAGVPAKGQGIAIFQPDTGVVPGHGEIPPTAHQDPRCANFVEGAGKPPVDALQGSGNPGHGTGTGTASVACSPEGGRMFGSAPAATLVPIRAIESVVVFDQSPVAQSIDHARLQGAHVITMSLGGIMSSALRAAARKAIEDNVLVLAAAGNCVGEVVWPARYPEVIAVAGTNEARAPWRGSCCGPAVDISAPAEFVSRANALDPDEPLAAVSGGQGTSFAVALTAGLAALWLAHHGRDKLIGMLPAGRKLQQMFINVARASAHVPANFDTANFGAGIVDALELLKFDVTRAFDPAIDHVVAHAADGGLSGLLGNTFGEAMPEALVAELGPQHAAELSCAALDRARNSKMLRARVESLPPPNLSPTLRRRIGGAVVLQEA